MKIAAVGSRAWNDIALIRTVFKRYIDSSYFNPSEDIVISGGAKGADKLCELVAKELCFKTEIILPDWNKYGRVAGFLRNTDIVNSCDIVLAFHDGFSKGTLDTIHKAILQKKYVMVFQSDGEKLESDYFRFM